MSFRNGDKARSGRLRKQRDRMRIKTRALRAELTTPATAESSSDGVVKTAAVKIGSALGTIVAATHLTGSEA
jgi:hypothetical protein